jgi:hypothetical protein
MQQGLPEEAVLWAANERSFHSLNQGDGVMKLLPRGGCRIIVTPVTCVIPLTEQQLTTTSIVTTIVIIGTTIVTAGFSQWRAVVAAQVDRHVRSWEKPSDHAPRFGASSRTGPKPKRRFVALLQASDAGASGDLRRAGRSRNEASSKRSTDPPSER